MFTGIIEQVGTIQKIEGNLFTISHSFEEKFEIGESIALNGMCSTILQTESVKSENLKNSKPEKSEKEGFIIVEIIEESRRLTTFGSATEGDLVNLERAAIIGGRNSGHNVTGHIDQTGEILKLERSGDYWLIRIRIDEDNRKLVVHKGSVAIEGISLTVSKTSPLCSSAPSQLSHWLEVSIISHTWEVTNLNTKKIGSPMNLEFDIYGKYVLNHALSSK